MEPQPEISVPFITRDMLDFKHGMKISLIAKIQTDTVGSLTLSGMTKAGPFNLKIPTTNTSFAIATTSFNLPDIPIWLSLRDDNGDYVVGSLFIVLSLAINGDSILNLITGYVDYQNPLSWPQTQVQRNYPFGMLYGGSGANPAPGTEISITVPTNVVWKLKTLVFQLVTDATVANRIVHLVINTGVNSRYEIICPTTQTASQTKKYCAYNTTGANSVANDNDIVISLPNDLILIGGATITTETLGLVAGDDYSNVNYDFEQWVAPF